MNKKLQAQKKPLNISIIMQSPDIGGAETYIYSLAQEFVNQGHTVSIATNFERLLRMFNELPVKQYKIPFIIDIMGDLKGLIKTIIIAPYAIAYYMQLLKRLKKENTDLILMSNFTEKMLVSFLSVFFKIPVVWIEYGRLTLIFKRNFYLPQFVYRCLQIIPKYIIIPSNNTRVSLIKDAHVSIDRLRVIPCGIRIPQENNTNDESLYPEWKNKIIIGNISRLTTEKGQDNLIKIIPDVIEKIPDARFIIVGDGPDKKYYEQLVKTLKIESYVKITGFVKDTQPYYQCMDIFVFTTVWELEGFGLVTVEAMLNKLPVIANEIGPVPEIVIDDKTGILVSLKEKDSLINAIILLARDKKKRVEFGEEGFKQAKEKYDIKKIVKEFTKLFYSSLDK